METGEEDEITEYSCRAKLYNFATVAEGKKEWKERGLGIVRLNVNKPAPGEEDEDGLKARLLMRAEGSHRVILNTPVKKEIKFGGPTGGQPQGGYVYFMGAVDGKEGLELLQLKASSCSANPFTLHLVLMGNTDTGSSLPSNFTRRLRSCRTRCKGSIIYQTVQGGGFALQLGVD